MRRRTPRFGTYGWSEAEVDLSQGVHPEVVAARLGEPIDFVLSTADAQGWLITWDGTPKNAKWIFAELDG
jgi:hypothetical protein